jgi:hypothetical protein
MYFLVVILIQFRLITEILANLLLAAVIDIPSTALFI